jgi:hypothetical protein
MPQMPGEKLHDFLTLLYRQHSLPLAESYSAQKFGTLHAVQSSMFPGSRFSPDHVELKLYSVLLSLPDFFRHDNRLGNFRHGLSHVHAFFLNG